MAKRERKWSARRVRLFRELRRMHLTSIEAREFSTMRTHVPPSDRENVRAKKQYPPALVEIVNERRAMWQAFVAEANAKGWNRPGERAGRWLGRLRDLYLSRIPKEVAFVVRDVHGNRLRRPAVSPWSLYDWTYRRLPANDQWDTPRTGRAPAPKSFDAVDRYVKKQLVSDKKWLEQHIKETGDPNGEFGFRLASVKFQLRTGLYGGRV